MSKKSLTGKRKTPKSMAPDWMSSVLVRMVENGMLGMPPPTGQIDQGAVIINQARSITYLNNDLAILRSAHHAAEERIADLERTVIVQHNALARHRRKVAVKKTSKRARRGK